MAIVQESKLNFFPFIKYQLHWKLLVGVRVADPFAAEPAKVQDTGQAHHSMPSRELGQS